MAIMNPYVRLCSDVTGIRHDELRFVIYLGKVEGMCRFCGEKDSPLRCSKCKNIVRYSTFTLLILVNCVWRDYSCHDVTAERVRLGFMI